MGWDTDACGGAEPLPSPCTDNSVKKNAPLPCLHSSDGDCSNIISLNSDFKDLASYWQCRRFAHLSSKLAIPSASSISQDRLLLSKGRLVKCKAFMVCQQ